MDYDTFDDVRFILKRQIEIAVAPSNAILAAIERHYGAPPSYEPAESVHLCDFPTGNAAFIDEQLSQRMELMREIVSLGDSADGREAQGSPALVRVEVVLADDTYRAWLEEHAALICDELNVKRVEFIEHAEQYITYSVLPDLKRLGPRLGKRLPAVRKMLGETDGAKLLAELETQKKITLTLPDGPVVLDADDIQVRLQAKTRLGRRPGSLGGRRVVNGTHRGVDPQGVGPRVGPHHSRPPQGASAASSPIALWCILRPTEN